jgi:hypothetical protein
MHPPAAKAELILLLLRPDLKSGLTLSFAGNWFVSNLREELPALPFFVLSAFSVLTHRKLRGRATYNSVAKPEFVSGPA